MTCNIFFGKYHRILVVNPFWARKGKVYMLAGTTGRVIDGQDLYGYVTLEFTLGRRRIRERWVVTDYSMHVEDLDFEA